MKPKKSVASCDEQKSDALKNLEVNLNDITAFLQHMRMGPEAAKRAVQKAMQAAEEVRQRRAAKNEPIDTKQLLSGLETATQAVANWAAFNVPALRWVAVMLVSYLEVYLEDVLIGIARKHSRIIKKADFQTDRHARCVADVPYAKRYAKRGAKASVEIKVGLSSLKDWLEAVGKFVNWADTFYLNATRSK